MQRQLSLVSGSQPSVLKRARQTLANKKQVLWLTQASLEPEELMPDSVCLPVAKVRSILGHEFSVVVFDAWSGLNVNALAAVAGTLRAGGTLVLLTPPLDEWQGYADPDYLRFLPYPWQPEQLAGYFLQRFVRYLTSTPFALRPITAIPAQLPAHLPETTHDQLFALQTIQCALQGGNAVIMTADRGRGKSAVLGMVAQRLLSQRKRVLLTAPARAVADIVFKHAADYQQQLAFIAPDKLLQTMPEVDVVLIDEAAAIPVPLLLRLQQHYPRCVFASTTQGYEGSGRGFVLRFQRALGEINPGYQAVRLEQPIRWNQHDVLETWLNQVLMLDVEVDLLNTSTAVETDNTEAINPAVLNTANRGSIALNYQQVSQQLLSTNEEQLRAIFSLLVSAHYQTRPADLRQLLDAPSITIHVLYDISQGQGGKIVAVALLAREGGLDAELVAEIHAGKRRPHGHMLAQSLTFHAGIAGAACLYGERIMRIAVHPDYRSQGVGQHLLRELVSYAKQQQADYVGVSYGLTPGLQHFWEQAGFKSARLGHRKDKASGVRSLMQIRGLSAAGKTLCEQAYQAYAATGQNIINKNTPSTSR